MEVRDLGPSFQHRQLLHGGACICPELGGDPGVPRVCVVAQLAFGEVGTHERIHIHVGYRAGHSLPLLRIRHVLVPFQRGKPDGGSPGICPVLRADAGLPGRDVLVVRPLFQRGVHHGVHAVVVQHPGHGLVLQRVRCVVLAFWRGEHTGSGLGVCPVLRTQPIVPGGHVAFVGRVLQIVFEDHVHVFVRGDVRHGLVFLPTCHALVVSVWFQTLCCVRSFEPVLRGYAALVGIVQFVQVHRAAGIQRFLHVVRQCAVGVQDLRHPLIVAVLFVGCRTEHGLGGEVAGDVGQIGYLVVIAGVLAAASFHDGSLCFRCRHAPHLGEHSSFLCGREAVILGALRDVPHQLLVGVAEGLLIQPLLFGVQLVVRVVVAERSRCLVVGIECTLAGLFVDFVQSLHDVVGGVLCNLPGQEQIVQGVQQRVVIGNRVAKAVQFLRKPLPQDRRCVLHRIGKPLRKRVAGCVSICWVDSPCDLGDNTGHETGRRACGGRLAEGTDFVPHVVAVHVLESTEGGLQPVYHWHLHRGLDRTDSIVAQIVGKCGVAVVLCVCKQRSDVHKGVQRFCPVEGDQFVAFLPFLAPALQPTKRGVQVPLCFFPPLGRPRLRYVIIVVVFASLDYAAADQRREQQSDGETGNATADVHDRVVLLLEIDFSVLCVTKYLCHLDAALDDAGGRILKSLDGEVGRYGCVWHDKVAQTETASAPPVAHFSAETDHAIQAVVERFGGLGNFALVLEQSVVRPVLRHTLHLGEGFLISGVQPVQRLRGAGFQRSSEEGIGRREAVAQNLRQPGHEPLRHVPAHLVGTPAWVVLCAD